MASRGNKHLRCPDAETLAEALADKCDHPQRSKEGWMVCCPAHDDSTPSLHITPADDKVLLKCFAGCTAEAVMAALGLDVGDLFVHHEEARKPRLVKIYDYVDAHGTLLHQKVRYEPKEFKQRRPDPVHKGKYIWKVSDIETVLYHLPEVMQAIAKEETIYLVEGEKSADALTELGLVATCSPAGAGKWSPAYSAMLEHAHVVILPDYDRTGAQHAVMLATALKEIAATVKIVSDFHTSQTKSDIADWLLAGGTREEMVAIVETTALYEASPNQAPLGWGVGGVDGATITATITHGSWRKELFTKGKTAETFQLTQNVFNIMSILANHEYWSQPTHALWFDSVRGTPMCGQDEITDHCLMDIAAWFGVAERLPITSPRLLEQCIIAHCKKHPRDLLAIWLNSLPPWDGISRLTTWLVDIAGVTLSDYVADTSRVLLVSMVARALDPGCHYRFVIILEGPEAIGKSALVRAMASPEWFVELSLGLETKEAHMMLQGAWVAELADLDSMTRTEETRMKAFITMRQDSYIPKYSNFRQRTERRAIFVGTTNDETYLKGMSGNTRYLPVRIDQPIDVKQFASMRSQLFAEALHYYQGHPETWWQFSDESLETAKEEREQRRVIQVYEHPLHEWLEYGRFAEAVYDNGKAVTFLRDETSWAEIAKHFLRLDTPEKWKDRSMQMQIAASLKGLGWELKQVWRSGRNMKVWRKPTETPF